MRVRPISPVIPYAPGVLFADAARVVTISNRCSRRLHLDGAVHPRAGRRERGFSESQ